MHFFCFLHAICINVFGNGMKKHFLFFLSALFLVFAMFSCFAFLQDKTGPYIRNAAVNASSTHDAPVFFRILLDLSNLLK